MDKKEPEAAGTLSKMLLMPDDVWEAENVRGKEIDRGLGDAVTASLSKALNMSRGKIPKAAWDPTILGEVAAPPQAASEPMKGLHSGAKTPIPQSGAGRVGKGEIPRPKRNVKKRSYGDASFEGYGEGFVDDDNNETGYSTGDGEDRTGRKRPKKVGILLNVLDPLLTHINKTAPHSFQTPQGPMRQNSYGPGMVGV